MQKTTHSIKFLRDRRLFTALPVLVLPFATLLLWGLGVLGPAESSAAGQPTGFNFHLPDAMLEEKGPQDKFAFYEQAEKDSAKLLDEMKADPYYQGRLIGGAEEKTKLLGLPTAKPAAPSLDAAATPEEAQLYRKLDELDKALKAPAPAVPAPAETYLSAAPVQAQQGILAEARQLEDMMAAAGTSAAGNDPEMAELNTMLERILDIQHPERVQQRQQQASREQLGKVFTVSGRKEQSPVTFLDNRSVRDYALETAAQIVAGKPLTENGFFGLDETAGENADQQAIAAVVAETQELVNGSTVKLRLLDEVYINGTLVPKDNFIYGTASLDGERLRITVPGIRYRNNLLPVSLSVYDLDGLAGIHIPGAITRDAAKESGEQAIQSLGIASMDPSLGAQAASAGIELSKNLLSRKVRLIRVTVKAGYQVLLMDEKQKQGM